MQEIIQWLEENMMACHTKMITGLDCFGCGMQRSLIHLLKGELAESIAMYPALIPFIVMLLFLPVHLKWKVNNGALFLKVLFILNVALMVLNVVLKNFIFCQH